MPLKPPHDHRKAVFEESHIGQFLGGELEFGRNLLRYDEDPDAVYFHESFALRAIVQAVADGSFVSSAGRGVQLDSGFIVAKKPLVAASDTAAADIRCTSISLGESCCALRDD